jgi:hypothetical protein
MIEEPNSIEKYTNEWYVLDTKEEIKYSDPFLGHPLECIKKRNQTEISN